MSSFTRDRKGNADVKHKKVSKRSTKIKKTDTNPYSDMETHIGCQIDPMPMTTGRIFDVDTQIEQHRKIDPAKVFENYTEPKPYKKEKKDPKKKINHIGRKHIDKSYTIKYGL